MGEDMDVGQGVPNSSMYGPLDFNGEMGKGMGRPLGRRVNPSRMEGILRESAGALAPAGQNPMTFENHEDFWCLGIV